MHGKDLLSFDLLFGGCSHPLVFLDFIPVHGSHVINRGSVTVILLFLLSSLEGSDSLIVKVACNLILIEFLVKSKAVKKRLIPFLLLGHESLEAWSDVLILDVDFVGEHVLVKLFTLVCICVHREKNLWHIALT